MSSLDDYVRSNGISKRDLYDVFHQSVMGVSHHRSILREQDLKYQERIKALRSKLERPIDAFENTLINFDSTWRYSDDGTTLRNGEDREQLLFDQACSYGLAGLAIYYHVSHSTWKRFEDLNKWQTYVDTYLFKFLHVVRDESNLNLINHRPDVYTWVRRIQTSMESK